MTWARYRDMTYMLFSESHVIVTVRPVLSHWSHTYSWFNKGESGEKLHGYEYLVLITNTIMLVVVGEGGRQTNLFISFRLHTIIYPITKEFHGLWLTTGYSLQGGKVTDEVIKWRGHHKCHRTVSKPQHFCSQWGWDILLNGAHEVYTKIYTLLWLDRW